MILVYQDTSYISRLVKPWEKGTELAQEVWRQFIAGRFGMLSPVLTENELGNERGRRTLTAFLQKSGVGKLYPAPFRNRWPPIIASVPNPTTGHMLLAGELCLHTQRPYRAGDSFENPVLTELCQVFGITGRELGSNDHGRDEEDIRHLIQAAEWRCDVFLTCEEKGKIWKRREEIQGVLGRFYAVRLEVLHPDSLLKRLDVGW